MTKKVVRNFGGWKSGNFRGKGDIGEILRGVRKKFRKQGENLKQRGNASLPQGDGRPWAAYCLAGW